MCSAYVIDQINPYPGPRDGARRCGLRNLANTYDNPWLVKVLSDDFRVGDITRNPAWTVIVEVDLHGVASRAKADSRSLGSMTTVSEIIAWPGCAGRWIKVTIRR